MSNKFQVSTESSLFNAKADWSLELDDELHMAKYQTMCNSLIALALAKMGEYALSLIEDPDALQHGYDKLVKAMNDA